MAIEFTKTTLTIAGVQTIIVSDIEPDEEGNYIRRLEIYTDPPSVANRRPVLELILSDTADTSLQIHTPQLAF